MKLLITAFRPFGKRKNNTSEDVLQHLRGHLSRQNDIKPHFLILPVNFRTSWPVLNHTLANMSPDAVLMLGEKNGRHAAIETIARNLRKFKRGETPIEKTDKKMLNTIFSVKTFVTKPKSRSVGAHQRWVISKNAGNYLCNFIYWKILSLHPKLPSLFLHVPALDGASFKHETAELARQTISLINKMHKQLRHRQSGASAQKQLTVPVQKAGRAKRKKES